MVGTRCAGSLILRWSKARNGMRHSASLPSNRVDAATPRPCVWFFHITGTNGIIQHVNALVPILGFAAQPMMEQAALPAPCGISATLGKTILPKGRPALHLDPGAFFWRHEEMQVVRHEQEIADQPCICWIGPKLTKQAHHRLLCTPIAALICADGAPEDRRAIVGWQYTLCGCATTNRNAIP